MRAILRIHFEHHDAAAIVEGDFVDVRENGRLNEPRANLAQLLLDALDIVHAFDAQLVVDAKNQGTAFSVRQGDDLRRDLLHIAEPDLELEVSVFAAAQQAHDLSACRQWRRRGENIFVVRAFRARRWTLAARAMRAFARHYDVKAGLAVAAPEQMAGGAAGVSQKLKNERAGGAGCCPHWLNRKRVRVELLVSKAWDDWPFRPLWTCPRPPWFCFPPRHDLPPPPS